MNARDNAKWLLLNDDLPAQKVQKKQNKTTNDTKTAAVFYSFLCWMALTGLCSEILGAIIL